MKREHRGFQARGRSARSSRRSRAQGSDPPSSARSWRGRSGGTSRTAGSTATSSLRSSTFTYYGFGWVKPWAGDGMYWHFALLRVLAVCITLGLAYRIVMPLFFLGFTYVFLLEQARY